MNELALMVVFIGNLTVTSYRSVPQQTDSSPYHTSTGERVSLSGAAISQDLLCGACRKLYGRCRHPEYEKKIHYGDLLYSKIFGFRTISDCMGKHSRRTVMTKNGKKTVFYKQNMWVDIWVSDLKGESAFHKQHGIKQHEVYILKRKP